MRKLKLVLILLWFLPIWGQAQNISIRFQHLSVNEGLSQATITAITQDKYGFIWVGTQDGLNRFEGYDFKTFRNNQQDSNSVSSSYILSLLTDSYKNIWVGTQLGLDRYDYLTEQFIKYPITKSSQSKSSHESINVITESVSKPGILWLGTNHGILEFNTQTFTYSEDHYHFLDTLEQRQYLINDIYESPNEPGILWVGSSDGLFRVNSINKKIERYLVSDGLSDNYINCIYEDSYQKLWIGTGNGLNEFNRNTEAFTLYKNKTNDSQGLSNGHISAIYEDSRRNLWIGTLGGGLNKYNRDLNNFTKWLSQPGNSTTISGNNISAIFEDQSGIMWFCTEGNGLNKVNPNYQNIVYHYHDPNNPNSLVGERIRSVIVDKQNHLWIATTNGISIYNPKTKNYSHLVHQDNNPNTIASNLIRVIYQDRKGFIWIGSRDGGLDKYDPVKKQFRNYKNDVNDKNSLSSNYIRAILEDEDGMIWIGTVFGGLNSFNPKTELFTHYYHDVNNKNSINDNRIYALFKDSKGILWLGTGSGIAKFNPVSKNFERILNDPSDRNSLSPDLIMGISEDHLGNIWFATYGGGISKLNPESGKYKRYTETEGLANNASYIVIEDKDYNLWISTNLGISKLNPVTEKFTNYDIEDGLQESEFNAGAYYKDAAGYIYFGGVNGLNIFDPSKLTQSEYVPPILITDFQIYNKTVNPLDSLNGKIILSKSILETDTIILSHQENIFSFSFVSLDYSNPKKNKYTYILENFENKWNDAAKRRFASYTNLSPGEYVFKVKGSSSSGIWNEEAQSVTIIIIPPWWKTKTFYFLSAIAILLIIIILFRTRLYQLKKDKSRLTRRVEERTKEIQQKNKILEQSEAKLLNQKKEIQKSVNELKEANATKDKFFNIIAHDLKNPFNIIQGYADILKTEYDKFTDTERKRMINEIDRSSEITFRLLENLLMWSRSQRGKIKIIKENTDLNDLVRGSINLYQANAKNKKIAVINTINSSLMLNCDKFTLNTIIGNLLNNAIKFTPENGEIKISGSETENQIHLSIKDNGVGMTDEIKTNLFKIDEGLTTLGTNNEKGTGLGLILCKEFVEMNNGTITVESKVGKGTTIKLSFNKSQKA